MKSTVIILLAICSCMSVKAQTVNGYQLSKIPADIIKVNVEAKPLQPFNYTVLVDWGQVGSLSDMGRANLIDITGEKAEYTGWVDVLNAFSAAGWEYMEGWPLCALMKRKPKEQQKVVASKPDIGVGDYVKLNVGDQRLPKWVQALVKSISLVDGKTMLTFEYQLDDVSHTKSLPLQSYEWKPN